VAELETTTRREPELGKPVFLAALRSALGRAPLWLICSLVAALPALVAAQPWFRWYDQAFAHHYAPGSQLANLDRNFRTDHAVAIERLNDSTASLGAVLAGLVMLAGAFCAGGWLQVFLERTEGHSVRRFFYGGSRYFWRFARVLLLTLLLLHLVGWLIYGTPWKTLVEGFLLGIEKSDLEVLDSERSALMLGWIQDGLYAFLFALVLAWGLYTRTRLALHGTFSSVWAGLCTIFTILRHPVRSLRPLVLLLGLEILVLLPLGAFASGVESGFEAGSTTSRVWSLAALSLAALVWRSIVWGASYSATVRVSQAIVPPIARPDPWRNRVGGPGGPQYPIGGDEYGVEL